MSEPTDMTAQDQQMAEMMAAQQASERMQAHRQMQAETFAAVQRPAGGSQDVLAGQ